MRDDFTGRFNPGQKRVLSVKDDPKTKAAVSQNLDALATLIAETCNNKVQTRTRPTLTESTSSDLVLQLCTPAENNQVIAVRRVRPWPHIDAEFPQQRAYICRTATATP